MGGPSCPSGSASAQARSPETQSPPTMMRREAKVPQLRLRKKRKRKKKRRRKKRKGNKCLTCQNQQIDDNSICRQTLLLQQKAISYNFKNRDYVRSRLYLKMTGNQTFEKM